MTTLAVVTKRRNLTLLYITDLIVLVLLLFISIDRSRSADNWRAQAIARSEETVSLMEENRRLRESCGVQYRPNRPVALPP